MEIRILKGIGKNILVLNIGNEFKRYDAELEGVLRGRFGEVF